MKKSLFNEYPYIAHRGLHDQTIVENSLQSFQEACNRKIPIELDVHLLKDGEVVVFHDNNLKRMTGINRKIKYCSYKDIQTYSLLNSKEKIPLLEDVLKEINGKVPILIEIKTDQPFPKLEQKILPILKKYSGIYYIQSFRYQSIYYLKRKLHHPIGLLIHNDYKKMKPWMFHPFLLKLLNIDFISYPIDKISNKKIRKLSSRVPILLWTIRTKQEKLKAEKYGDAIIFENTSCEII